MPATDIKDYVAPKSEDPPVPRKDWERNQLAIEKAFFEFLDINKRCATIQEIADITGLGWDCVDNHLETMSLDEVARPLRALMPRVLLGQARAGIEGNPAAAKLFAQIAGKFREETVENVRDLTMIEKIGEEIISAVSEIVTNREQCISLVRRIGSVIDKIDGPK
jgi:hypothetical protein